jgi:hypothetical protein
MNLLLNRVSISDQVQELEEGREDASLETLSHASPRHDYGVKEKFDCALKPALEEAAMLRGTGSGKASLVAMAVKAKPTQQLPPTSAKQPSSNYSVQSLAIRPREALQAHMCAPLLQAHMCAHLFGGDRVQCGPALRTTRRSREESPDTLAPDPENRRQAVRRRIGLRRPIDPAAGAGPGVLDAYGDMPPTSRRVSQGVCSAPALRPVSA